MCQVCTRRCIICDEERCSKCGVEEYVYYGLSDCRGEDGDPVCLACLAENKAGDSGLSDSTEMVQHGL
jgi:hypothetical protein